MVGAQNANYYKWNVIFLCAAQIVALFAQYDDAQPFCL